MLEGVFGVRGSLLCQRECLVLEGVSGAIRSVWCSRGLAAIGAERGWPALSPREKDGVMVPLNLSLVSWCL